MVHLSTFLLVVLLLLPHSIPSQATAESGSIDGEQPSFPGANPPDNSVDDTTQQPFPFSPTATPPEESSAGTMQQQPILFSPTATPPEESSAGTMQQQPFLFSPTATPQSSADPLQQPFFYPPPFTASAEGSQPPSQPRDLGWQTQAPAGDMQPGLAAAAGGVKQNGGGDSALPLVDNTPFYSGCCSWSLVQLVVAMTVCLVAHVALL